jgi:AMME syndrome candidate gene 1 protein
MSYPEGSRGAGSVSATVSATVDMCIFCFDTILDYYGEIPVGRMLEPPRSVLDNDHQCPLFVTWDIQTRRGYDLRGCIGCLSPIPLLRVGEYAITSSMKDRRFQPIALAEIPCLRCCVSLLTAYEQGGGWDDWEVGKHGIIIDFFGEGGGNSVKFNATYLPHVAPEQRWDQRQAVKSLVKKSGYRGVVTDSLLSRIQLTRYQSSKAYCTYEQYLEFTQRSAAGQ